MPRKLFAISMERVSWDRKLSSSKQKTVVQSEDTKTVAVAVEGTCFACCVSMSNPSLATVEIVEEIVETVDFVALRAAEVVEDLARLVFVSL